jgi:flagellar hook-length control protein FliK
LFKNVQDALPGIAWDRWATGLASQDRAAEKISLEIATPADAKANQDGAAEKVLLEKANPTGAGLISAAGSQHDGLLVRAGHAARGVLLDAKGAQVAADKGDAAVCADELSDRDRPAADERGPGAGRVMPALPPAASPPAETLRSTAVSSKAQASEGSFVLPKNFEATPDSQSEVSDDSRSPADKATAGLALSTADRIAEEGGSPSLRFDAALRDVRSFAVPEGSPDKPAEAAAAVKGRDTAAAPVKTDVFDQIVQRAAVHVKSDQGEMRIDLKPEFLGHVRLQIVTENQQVTVRILTELPMVRDMIESNIQQLKSDLQQQGLRVERVEVAVADDPREHPGRQAWTGAGRKGHADGDVAPAAAEISAGLRPEAAYRWGLGEQTTINMFA